MTEDSTPRPTLATGHRDERVAPWFVARDLLRSRLSHKQATDIGNAFARYVPRSMQRAFERQFDFPVAKVVRSAPLLLVRIPKTASVSLSLQVYGQVSHVPHRTAAFYRDADPEFFARTTSFAVLRNPWLRAASAYRWLRGRGNELAAPDRHGRASVHKSESFEHFVFDVLEPAAAVGRLHHLDPVLHAQADYVCDASGNIIVDHLFRLERMYEVQAFLAERAIVASEIYANASEPDVADTKVSAAATAALGRIYARDAAMFDYRAPSPSTLTGARSRV